MNQPASNWVKVCKTSDFGGMNKLKYEVGGIEILIIRQAGNYYALRNHCTHLGKSLEKGRIMGGQITCPYHGACFDIVTGRAISGPAVFPLATFPVKTEGQNILVDVAGLGV